MGDAGWSSPVARWAHNPKVAGSNPAPATNLFRSFGGVAQLAERGLCKPEVRGSNPLASTNALLREGLKESFRADATGAAADATNAFTPNRVAVGPPEVEHSKQFAVELPS